MSIDLKHLKTSLSQFKRPENKNTRMHHQLIPSLALTSLRLPTKLKWRLNLGTESQWRKSSVKNWWFMAWGAPIFCSPNGPAMGASPQHEMKWRTSKTQLFGCNYLAMHCGCLPSKINADQRWSTLINCRFKYVESSVAKLVKCLAIPCDSSVPLNSLSLFLNQFRKKGTVSICFLFGTLPEVSSLKLFWAITLNEIPQESTWPAGLWVCEQLKPIGNPKSNECDLPVSEFPAIHGM